MILDGDGESAATGSEFETLDAFLRSLASGSPAPGGGAAAALAGALAAALVGMVCRVTARHAPPRPGQAEATERADELRGRLATLVTEDAEAYRQVLEAGRLPAETRVGVLQPALEHATSVPLEVARCSRVLLSLCEAVGRWARPTTLGDLGVAVDLAGAALESSALIARINLKHLADATLVGTVESELDSLTGDGARLRQDVLTLIAERA